MKVTLCNARKKAISVSKTVSIKGSGATVVIYGVKKGTYYVKITHKAKTTSGMYAMKWY